MAALVSAIALGGTAGAVSAAAPVPSGRHNLQGGWKLPTGTKLFGGQVSVKNDDQLTLIHPMATSAPSVLVNLTSNTTYLGGTLSDITAGTRISGVGIKQSDGSYRASSIRINPAGKVSNLKKQREAGIRPFFGTITANSGSTITLDHSLGNGSNSSITINLTASTTYASGGAADLTVGSKVSGLGTINADKSLSALKIVPNSNDLKTLWRNHRKAAQP